MSLPTTMLAFTGWLELAPPASGPLISVVLVTHDRPHQLARAISSVIGQRYECWQLVVVDDGVNPDTRTIIGEAWDERMVLIEGGRRGPAAARNNGLTQARGEIVCYLDDDNVMHPAWLQAVAHVFTTHPDVEVGYGISLAEHRIPGELGGHGWWPSFWQLPWSREDLQRENLTDMGSIAHRRDLDGVRFNEDLRACEDWDLLLHLTAEREALAIPALSHAYTMDGDDRQSLSPRRDGEIEAIRRRYQQT